MGYVYRGRRYRYVEWEQKKFRKGRLAPWCCKSFTTMRKIPSSDVTWPTIRTMQIS